MATMIPQAHSRGTYDVKRVRAEFPILDRDIYGKSLVYLDNASSSQKPRASLEAMDHAYRMEYSNVHRGLHYLSNAATAKYDEARDVTARFLNAPSSDEIVFVRNATEAINLVAQSFGGLHIKPGDEIVLSILEHHSNIVPWHFHRERNGAVLKWAPIADDGTFLLDAFEKLLTPRTKMVAITHMSNVTGTLVPIKEVIKLAHARGIPVLVDGSQSAVHMPIDVQDLGCDFFVFTGHKTYGPSGVGVLWAKREHLEAMPPFMGGGSMIESVHVDRISYGKLPHKFEAGTPAIVPVIGLGAALTYMMQVGRDRIAVHEAELTRYAAGRLSEFNWLKLYGTTADKGGIFAFGVEGLHPHDISTIIDRSGIAVRAGHHCAQPLMERFGVTATCRASFGMYNTREDVDALADALVKAHDFFA